MAWKFKIEIPDFPVAGWTSCTVQPTFILLSFRNSKNGN